MFKGMSRLSIELTPDQHQKIKAVAALHGCSIRDYVLERILPSPTEEQAAFKELEDFLKPRLEAAQRGETVTMSAKQVFEETLR